MVASKAKDKFANIAYLTVTESALNTLTFARLEMANNLLSEKAALVIHQADVFMASPIDFNSSGDRTDVGICLTDRLTDISDLSQPELLWFNRWERYDIGVAASGWILEYPLTRDFSSLPGGGLLVPADRLYVGIESVGLASVQAAYIRLYYTVLPLKTEDYWELIEARRIMTT